MPYDIRIIRSREFMHLDAEGHLDLETSRRLFADAMWACIGSKIGRVLLDVRDVTTTDLTASGLCSLADVCKDVSEPSADHKIAILNRPKDNFDRAAFLAATVRGEGWNIAAFRDFEEAFAWLMS